MATVEGDTAGESPLFATVAQFCTLGVAEEGAALAPVGIAPGGGGGDGKDGQAAALPTVGGGGAVTPAMLPSLFPKREAACALSEGVRMVLSNAEHEGGPSPGGGDASPGMFSLHSMASQDIIVKASIARTFECFT